MPVNPSLQKASLLIGQARYDMAEKELRTLLTHEPQDTSAMRLLAICLLSQGRSSDALVISGDLVGMESDEPQNLYIHAAILLNLEQVNDAEHYVHEAISLYPHDADYFELLARIYLHRKEWETALQYAYEGLATDPAHVGCLNTRTTALTKLNRKEEAARTIENVLEQDPENPYSHANVGWARLEQGDHKGAQVHFAEALRLDPSMENARAGMLEALKAGNFIYRGFLAFFFWLARFQGKTQWGVIVGIYIVSRVIRTAAKSQPMLMPVAVGLSLLIYLTWVIQPVFNLFMRLHPRGKYLLTQPEREGANWVGALLGVALTALGISFANGMDDFLILALVAGTMVMPVGALYGADTPKQKRVYRLYTLGLTLAGLAALLCTAFNAEAAGLLTGIYFLGIFAFGWVVNTLTLK
jgi:tetratricopeptide (TPR) repeat protein